MKNKRPFSTGINIGSVSIVMIFSVLVLAVFSILTFLTSNNEKKLAEKSAKAVSLYYAADSVCEEKLADIKSIAESCDWDQALLKNSLPAGCDVQQIGDRLYISYSADIDKNRLISVLAEVRNKKIGVLKWEVVNSGSWNPDDEIHFWAVN